MLNLWGLGSWSITTNYQVSFPLEMQKLPLPKGCWQEMKPKVTKLIVLPQPNFASEQHFLSSLWAEKAPPRAGALSCQEQ